MSIVKSVFMRMFGRPRGVLGRLGGAIMARTNQTCAVWVIGLLDIRPNDTMLEVGFGRAWASRFWPGRRLRDMLQAWINPRKWWSKRELAT